MQIVGFEGRPRCRGRHVVAVVVGESAGVWVGNNGVDRQQALCPRRTSGPDYVRGGQWDICSRVCGQQGHAEVQALQAAGAGARGSTLLLFGHDTVCPACAARMAAAGVKCYLVADPLLS